MGHITIHRADLVGAINLYIVKTGGAQVALWQPGPLGQQRPQGETNTQRLTLLLPPSLSIPFRLPSHSLCLSEAHCLSSLSSVHLHNSAVQ